MKDLKQLVRDIVEPNKDLGHSDSKKHSQQQGNNENDEKKGKIASEKSGGNNVNNEKGLQEDCGDDCRKE